MKSVGALLPQFEAAMQLTHEALKRSHNDCVHALPPPQALHLVRKPGQSFGAAVSEHVPVLVTLSMLVQLEPVTQF